MAQKVIVYSWNFYYLIINHLYYSLNTRANYARTLQANRRCT